MKFLNFTIQLSNLIFYTPSPITPPISRPIAIDAPLVTVKNGSYTGLHNPHYKQDFFLGIPFAQPPLPPRRFLPPLSLNSTWNGTKQASSYPPYCIGYGNDSANRPLSEDCLYLNIIRPTPAAYPSSTPLPIAKSVELNTPIIGISIQYRLSAWGFLGGAEALENGATNVGYRDQRLALHWIQENIAAFGGDREKVTIWGESAGGESVGAHLLAYNGRDDKLFRAAICQSGGPAINFFPTKLPAGYNSTVYQTTYDTLVSRTPCLPGPTSFSCLQSLSLATLNTALNISTTGLSPFVPTIDHDFITTYPSLQLSAGNFVHVPLIIGTNTDEGSGFSLGTGINTDAEFTAILYETTPLMTPDLSSTLSSLYPNIQSLGIPSLDTFPHLITPTSPNLPFAPQLDQQFRRTAAFIGDLTLHAARRLTTQAWSTRSIPVWSYRFDVQAHGVAPYMGASHFQEVAFVFRNKHGAGYAINPLGGDDATALGELAESMSRAWVGFVARGDPNAGLDHCRYSRGGSVEWKPYDAILGGGNLVWRSESRGGSINERDIFRGEGIAFIMQNLLVLFGL
ncbi:hypothetical protein B7494_g7408 [Chlorociboria aeruginascens]|nr:hypothetical protein B7494_g7408 [Chlorociboria aeruginascens]